MHLLKIVNRFFFTELNIRVMIAMKGGDTLNDRIKLLRKKLGLTQVDFGAKVGISGGAVSQIESGSNVPSEPVIRAISREFGVDYVWLKTGEGDMHDVPVIEQDMLLFHNLMNSGDEVAKALFRAYAKKFDGRWHLVREFLEGVLADAAEQEKGKVKDEP